MIADVVVLTGPPGAGKSTTARALARQYERAVHLHTDDFWKYIAAGAIPPYLPESDEQNQTVMRVIRDAAFAYAEGGFVRVRRCCLHGLAGSTRELLSTADALMDEFRVLGIDQRGHGGSTRRRRAVPSEQVDDRVISRYHRLWRWLS